VVGDFRNFDVLNVDFVLLDQIQEQVEGAFEAGQFYAEFGIHVG
jgi:hypothetical protein